MSKEPEHRQLFPPSIVIKSHINIPDGWIDKLEEWCLMNFSNPIKQNKRGNYLHFKFEGDGKIVEELEKKERIDDQLLRFMTVKYKKLDLKNNFFAKKEG